MGDRLTKRTVDALEASTKDQFRWCGEIPGFGVKCTPRGTKVFLLTYRFPKGRAGKVKRWTIGTYGQITVDQAREVATIKRGEIARGIDPMAELQVQRQAAIAERAKPRTTVKAVIANFMKRHAKAQNRSWAETQRIFDHDVIPAWGSRQIESIARADVVELLDGIEDRGAPVMADRTLAAVRKLFRWHAARHDTFVPPIVPGMSRVRPKERARTRVLTDAEIRLLWRALDDQPHPFGPLVRLLLLTAQRRDEVAGMRRSEVTDALWTIPADRYKTKLPNVVPLSDSALSVLAGLPRRGDLVFTSTGETAFSGFSKAKRALDARMVELAIEALGLEAVKAKKRKKEPLVPPWTLHDLRRTGKTLMQRAGVRPDVSERVLGHVIAGVEGTYDRHTYEAERKDALDRLATLLARIIDPPAGNVIEMRPAAA